MKKSITISLGSIVFHIEEDAHQKLSAYLDAISASMQGSEGRDEIMADIESRIAEILQPKVNSFKQVINIADVEEVISTMGSPEEFSTGNAETKEEPVMTGGRGRQQYGQRRIFRDPDDKVLGGVCSGLAYHFGVDPLWLRLGFGLSIFLGGFGIIIYILLLIILPKAMTAAEKLEMRGEPVDAKNIRKIIEEEMGDFKKNAKNFANDMKNWKSRSRYSSTSRNFSDFFSTLGHGVGSIAATIIKAILAFVGFIIVIVLAALLIGLIVSFFSGVNIHGHGQIVNYTIGDLFSMLSINGSARTLIMIGLFLFLGIPLIALIVRFGRAIMGVRSAPRWYTMTIFFAWFAGLLMLLFGAAQTAHHFSAKDRVTDEVKFMPSGKTLHLIMPGHEEDEVANVTIDSLNFYVNDNDLFEGNPSLCISASPDSSFHLMMYKTAHGENGDEANRAARSIEYGVAQHDSVLQMNSYYSMAEGAPWRAQKLEAVLEIPVNKSVAMPSGIDHIMCSNIHHKFHHLGGHTWTMTTTGLVAASSDLSK
jgi:phage shock protein C